MPGGSTTTQNQTQNSSTSPWAAAIPAVTGLLNQVGSTPTGTNSSQTSAVSQLENNANTAPNFGAPVASATSSLLSGGNPAYSGILNNAYSTLQSNLTPFANGSMVGNNTALKGQLDTIGNDVQNSVQSQFAAAGRSMSPDEAQAIARGTAMGEAPVIAGQYNTDVGNQLAAAGTLFNAGNTTGTNLNSINAGNITTGAGLAQTYPGILNANANSLLTAGNTEQSLPYTGTGLAESQLLPIAALGATSTGNSSGTTTQETSPVSNILGGILGAASLASKFIPSDEDVKTDKQKVGILNDGQAVYRFRYKGDPSKKVHIGLLAQEVEDVKPGAVRTIGGVKHVNYDAATKAAA